MTKMHDRTKPALEDHAAWADEAFARRVLPTRAVGTHKWEVGGVVVIAGSPSFTGAAWLASRSAGRSGAGIVSLASGRGVITTLAAAMPEVTHIMLPETDAPGAAKRAVDRLAPHLEKARSVVIGPGLGDDALTDHFLGALFGFGPTVSGTGARIGFSGLDVSNGTDSNEVSPLFDHEPLKVVIDADALTWLSRQESWWDHIPAGRVVLTPHPGEMAKLTGLSTEEITSDPQRVAREYASQWDQVVVLKSGYTVASDGMDSRVAEDAPTSLATAGTGDVLAGIIGAFLAQGVALLDAAGLALFLGARAGRALEERFGELGVIATDLPDAIGLELGNVLKGERSA